MYRPVGLASARGPGLRRLGRRAPARAHRSVQDPPPEAPARPCRLGGGLRDRALRRERRPDLPPAAHAGLRGLDDLPLPPDRWAHAGGRPRAHPRGHGPRRGRRAGDAPEPVAVRALLRRPRALDGACARLQRLCRRALHPVLRSTRSDRTRAPHRHRRRGRRDRAGRGGRLPGDPPARDSAAAVLLARPRPGVGRGPGQRRARVHPHADRRREGQRPGGDDAQGGHGVGRAGQPADDREVRVEADDHAMRLRPDRPATGHLPADRRRRARALSRPALRVDRVQRPLAGVVGGQHGQVLGHRHRPGRRLVARGLGRHASHRRPAEHGPAVPPEREVALPARAERVRPAPVPRLVPGRPRRGRVPARHRVVHDRLGQRLPARRRDIPREPRAPRARSSATSPPPSGPHSSAGRWAGSWASSRR